MMPGQLDLKQSRLIFDVASVDSYQSKIVTLGSLVLRK